MKTKFKEFLTLLLAFVVQISFAQEKTVSGTVSDESGPLPGVSVLKKGTTQGAETNFDGKYSIQAKSGDVLIFSFVGMETVEKTVGANNTINVSLKAGNVLDEVVVNALGVEKKKDDDLSSSTIIKTDAISRSGETGVVQGLAGKTSGLRITKNSGDPGSGAYIQIRGQNTIIGSSSPLIIVDGVPVSNSNIGGGIDGVVQQSRLNDFNAEDIENVSVLKGASAAAVWGTGAANGVIVITTKKGKAGKLSVNFKSQVSIDEINIEFEKQDKFGQGYPAFWYGGTDYSSTAAYWVPNVALSWGDKISERSGQNTYIVGNERFVSSTTGKVYYPIDTKGDKTVYNKANRDQVFGTGITLDNNLSLSFSSEKSRTFASFSSLEQDGIIKGNSDYTRRTVRLNHELQLYKDLKLKINTSYANIESNRIQQGSNLQGLYLGYLRTAPDFDNTDYTGTYYNSLGIRFDNRHRGYRNYLGSKAPAYGNPGWVINRQENPNTVKRFTIAPEVNFTALGGVNFTGRFGYDTYEDVRESYFPKNSSASSAIGSYGRTEITETTQNINFFAQKDFEVSKNFNIDVILGTSLDQNVYNSFGGSASDFVNTSSDLKVFFNSISENISASKYFEKTRKQGYYGVLSTSIYDQLLIELTGRYDKSSTLKDWVFYPSASIGWQFSKLIENNNFLSFGKIRASYGEIGITPSAYSDRTYYSFGGSFSTWEDGLSAVAYGTPYGRSVLKGNPDLTVETVKEFEVGADFRFFKNRLNLGVTYYDRKTEDALLQLDLPGSSGYQSYYDNAAEIVNKGFEVDLGVDIVKKENFSWRVDANFSKNKNEVTSLNGVESVFLAGFTGTSSRAVEGHPIASLWGVGFLRDDQGKYVLDANGFPKVDSKEKVLGDPNPDWIGGIGTVLKYKNLSLSAQFETSQGNDHWTGTEGVLKYFGIHPETANESTSDKDLKTFDGRTIPAGTTFRGNIGNFGGDDVALTEEWYLSNGGGFGAQSESFIKDASWTRLREVTLAYSFPESVTSSLGLNNFELSVSGRNLFLWTDIEGFDPDINLTGASKGRGLDYFTNPSTRSYIMTLKLGF